MCVCSIYIYICVYISLTNVNRIIIISLLNNLCLSILEHMICM